MNNKALAVSAILQDYLQAISLREPELLRQLRADTARFPIPGMQIPPEQGQLMAILIHLMRATKALEIGAFTGYSALVVAKALPANGKLIACEIDPEAAQVARQYWEAAGVADKIDLRLAPAVETLDALIASGESGSFDFVFIDADKENYDNYYERALQLVRPGGLIAVDNIFPGCPDTEEFYPEYEDSERLAIRALNEKLHRDERITLCTLPISQGLTLALKL